MGPGLLAFVELSLLAALLTVLVHAGLLFISRDMDLLKSSVGASALASLLLALVTAGSERFHAVIGYAVSTMFFAYQLFFFLGPATADRSMTAHLLMWLAERERREADLRREMDADAFLSKRLIECSDAGLVTRAQDTVQLRPRGRRLALIYRALVRLYGLDRRKAWRSSFHAPNQP